MISEKKHHFLVGVLTNGARSDFVGSATNPASRALVTKKNKVDATQKIAQKTVSSGTTASQVRDLTQTLIRLRGNKRFLKWNQIWAWSLKIVGVFKKKKTVKQTCQHPIALGKLIKIRTVKWLALASWKC